VLRTLCLCFALATIAAPVAASAADSDAVRAAQIQAEARDAHDAGDQDKALRLCTRAIALDPGPATWLAQQLRIEILEERGELDEAWEHLRAYLALDGLFPEHRAWGEEADDRISAAREAAAAQARRTATLQRGAGIGLIVGGAVPLGVGVGFLAQYGSKTSDPLFTDGWYDGFLDGGAALTAAGATVLVVGVIVAATAPKTDGFAALPTFDFDGRTVRVGLTGRF